MRLRALSDRSARLVRAFWVVLFGLAFLADIGATIYVLRDTYEVQPVFARWGLDYDVEYDGRVLVGTLPDSSGKQQVETQAQVLSLNGHAVSPRVSIAELRFGVESTAGPALAIDLKKPDGTVVSLQQKPVKLEVDRTARQQRDMRIATRLTTALIACAALLACSLLLGLRRPTDPVAMLFAIAFAAMAATIDPPLQMWMGLRLSLLNDVIAGGWYYLLLIALATFPDGIFVPRFYRWLIPAGIPLAIFLSLPDVDANVQALIGVFALLAILIGQAIRYRRAAGGIERQQIKWAGFGFVVGLVLLLGAFIVLIFIPENPAQQNAWVNLSALVLFSLGMAAIPLGLLIALTRYRLWEADTVITRSAAYAVVTIIVGVVWAATTDLAKLIVEQVVGRESQAGATAVSAVIAAGIFSPTQSVVLGWTRKRFGGPIDRIRGAAQRLKSWGLTETPEELATRALAIIDDAIHPSASAIVMDTATGRDLLAAREVSSPDDAKLIERLVLADEESSVGTLLIGRRSDGNRYNRQELEAVQEMIPHLADALRVARSRHSRESVLQQRIDEMAARLAQIEGGQPKPA
jgi:hypothetical protein